MMNGLINTVIDGIQQEIIHKKYIVKPIRYRKQTDKCNGKIRNIGIQDVKQQIYDYIAVYAMGELFRKKLGFYQCGALKKKGNDFGAKCTI
jgi:RNA-directed DNA polymerase